MHGTDSQTNSRAFRIYGGFPEFSSTSNRSVPTTCKNLCRKAASYRYLQKPVFLAKIRSFNVNGKTALYGFIKIFEKLFKGVPSVAQPGIAGTSAQYPPSSAS